MRRPSPFQRVAAVADFGNGVGSGHRPQALPFINPDLTITLHRLPVGRVGRPRRRMFPEPTGIGVAESVLHDEHGRIGRGIQTVLIEELMTARPVRADRDQRTRLATAGVRPLAVVGLVAP